MEESLTNIALNAVAHTLTPHVEYAMRYSNFMARLYNFCLSVGMEKGKILPGRAFCSDENQAFPIVLMGKHFGAFPFNLGRTGGIVAPERYGLFADHGRDLVIVQGTHVGYDTETKSFGTYRRLQTESHYESPTCGKVGTVLSSFMDEYRFASENINLAAGDSDWVLTIDNQLLDMSRSDGLILDLDFMLAKHPNGSFKLIEAKTVNKLFVASEEFKAFMTEHGWPQDKEGRLGNMLAPELFNFRRSATSDDPKEQMRVNMLPTMPFIVTAKWPMLAAAQATVEVEFDRCYRAALKEPEFSGRTLVYITGVNIDISSHSDSHFPITLFVPWAAYVQPKDAEPYVLEQPDLVETLLAQSADNTDEMDLEAIISRMRVESQDREGIRVIT